MVVKLMRWPSWPPLSSRKFEVSFLLQRMESLETLALDGTDGLLVDITWKGQKGMLLPSLPRFAKRNSTLEAALSREGLIVEWNEEFRSFCTVSPPKDGSPHPWEILFTVSKKNAGQKGKVVIGVGSLNIATYASVADGREIKIEIPLKINGETSLFFPFLCLCLSMVELKTAKKRPKTAQRLILPVTRSPPTPVSLSREKDELSLKDGLKRVKIFGDCVSGGSPTESYSKEELMLSGKTDCACHNYQFDDDSEEEESEGKVEFFNSIQPFNYETLACANLSRGSSFSNTLIDDKDEQWTYYGNVEHSIWSFSDQLMPQISKRKTLSWRKLGFRSPKRKGEPLLNNSEEGGDDIDHYRRQLSSFEESRFEPAVSMFGDDVFLVGSWEEKEVTSRDNHLKLQTKIFFASIDQRNERAAGESACTALVVVIADWLQSNWNRMPTKSEFDCLIREGSSQWRNLCENKDYIEKFPDKHFDIDTILQARICPLDIEHEESFVGFFNLNRLEDGGCDLFEGAMSFDSMWDEIAQSAMDCPGNGDPLIYIVSWNDHFFILKVEQEAYYIIDTLGERLFEGCNEAYILKFDKDTTIQKLSDQIEASNEKPCVDKVKDNSSDIDCADKAKENSSENGQLEKSEKSEREEEIVSKGKESCSDIDCADKAKENSSENGQLEKLEKSEREEEIVSKGKESCKEYIKSFLAAIPIREAEADIKKGLPTSTTIHRRLQIEFHRTLLTKPKVDDLFRQAREKGNSSRESMGEVVITENQ